jgi:hypothetical protein
MSTIETFSEYIVIPTGKNLLMLRLTQCITVYIRNWTNPIDVPSRSSKNRTSLSSTLCVYLPPLICAHKSRGSRGVYFPPSYTCYKRRSSTVPSTRKGILLYRDTLACAKVVGDPIETTGQKLRYYMQSWLEDYCPFRCWNLLQKLVPFNPFRRLK